MVMLHCFWRVIFALKIRAPGCSLVSLMASLPLLNIPSILCPLHSSALGGLSGLRLRCWPKPPWYLSHWNPDKKTYITFAQLVHNTPPNSTFLSFPKFSTKIFPAPNRRRYTGFLVYVKLLFSPLYLISLPLNRPLLLANYRIQKQYLPIFTIVCPPHSTASSNISFFPSSINIESLISYIISFHNRSCKISLHAHCCLLSTLLFLILAPLITKLTNKSKFDFDPWCTSSVCVFMRHAENLWKQPMHSVFHLPPQPTINS